MDEKRGNRYDESQRTNYSDIGPSVCGSMPVAPSSINGALRNRDTPAAATIGTGQSDVAQSDASFYVISRTF